uniref:Self-incompatibility-linked fibrinogen-like protein-B n=1 Tax=Ciona intestinalis TaxID=7719 RepID=A0A143RFU5_CIOIN|nr:self-incompatibility-linked fibrinogen-like protein-B [Ciona intestinalis]
MKSYTLFAFLVFKTLLCKTSTQQIKEISIMQTEVAKLPKQVQFVKQLMAPRMLTCQDFRLSFNTSVYSISHQYMIDAKIEEYSPIYQMFTECKSIWFSGNLKSGIYPIWLLSQYRYIYVQCDMDKRSEIGNKTGWVVFQQRQDGTINFNRGWESYVSGFGNLNNDYWAGLENIMLLTIQKTAVSRFGYNTIFPNLRVDMEGWDGFHAYVEYEDFFIYTKKYRYEISDLGKRYGTAFASFTPDAFLKQEFSTFDNKDELKWFDTNCPGPLNGGWWFATCSLANLNGRYPHSFEKMSIHNIYWRYWPFINTNNTALRYVSMKML